MNIPSPLPKTIQSSHAKYDAGLLQVSRATHRAIARKRLTDPCYMHQFEIHHIRPWNVPWFLIPRTSYDVSLALYQQDTVSRLTHVLQTSNVIEERDLRLQDVQRFIQHWAHTLLLQSISVHTPRGGAVRAEQDMLSDTRRTLITTIRGNKRPIIAESPAHPSWGKRGSLVRSLEGVNRWCIEGTVQQEKIARHLTGPASISSVTPECRASDVARSAVPELLSLDRGELIERQAKRRMDLRFALQGKEKFTDALREDTIDELTEIWVTLNETLTGELLALEKKYKGPNPIDGDIDRVFDAYIGQKVLQPEQYRAELQECLPVLIHLTIRSVLEKNVDKVNALCLAWDRVYTVCDLDPSAIDLAFIITGIFRGWLTPADVLNSL